MNDAVEEAFGIIHIDAHFEMAGVVSKLDPALTSVFTAGKIITECLGHRRLQ
ncbi:MAG: hypothetical protein JEZ08_00475 [Clostridiales bacterium]|nr:hypothetical protein [Clostridiales bacterium]